MLGLALLAEQVAIGVDDAARLAGGAGGEDDQRRVLGAHLLDRGRGLLRQVLVEDAGDVGHRHRRHPVGQLGQQLFFTDAKLGICSGDPVLEIVPAQHRAAGQRHRSHPPAGEQGQHPLDPVADQGHHHIAALNAPRRKGAGEPGRLGDQFAEVVVAPGPLGVQRNDPQPRGRGSFHQVLDQVHGLAVCRTTSWPVSYEAAAQEWRPTRHIGLAVMAIRAREGSVQRLAQYRPFERGGLDLRAVLRDLTIAVAAIEGGELDGVLGLREGFKDCWGLEVEVEELTPIIDELIDQGLVERGSQRGFKLRSNALADLEQKAVSSQEIEERAIREWRVSVRELDPSISEADLDALSQDLREWLHLLIARHGAEAAMMLYPEEERARQFFDELDAHGFDALPERSNSLKEAREQALPLFIRQPTPAQRQFLAALLNTSFYMTVLTIDPDAKHLVQEQLRGRVIYLDTNFLYAVLGAASPEEVYSARRLVELSRDLGIELAVTPWTISELHTSIGRSRREIEEQSSFIRDELADLMLRASGEKGFNRYFWQTYAEKRTKPKDFFDRLDHFESDLSRYGIKERREGCIAVEQQTDRIQAYSSLLNSERWPHQKDWVVLEHDAMCRLLVERIRGEGHLQFSTAKAWFLTYDTKLPRFAERAPDGEPDPPDLPFCISPSAWIQIIRALTPRTEDFDRTVVDLLTSPYVGYRRAINQSVVQEVVGRMDHFEDASPELALAILTDGAKVKGIADAVEDQDEEKLNEAVEGAYSSKAKELQDAVVASEARAAEVVDALERAERRAEDAETARDSESVRVAGARGDLRTERNARKKREADMQAELTDSERARQQVEDESQKRIKNLEEKFEKAEANRIRTRRLAFAFGLALMGILVGVLPVLVGIGRGGAVTAVTVGWGLVLFGGCIAIDRRWRGELLAWAAVLATIAAAVIAFVFSSSSS